jgi:hypothetical protein
MIEFLNAISQTHIIFNKTYRIDNPYLFLRNDTRIKINCSDSLIVFTDLNEKGTEIKVNKLPDSLYEMNLTFLDKVYISSRFKINIDNEMLEEVEINVLPMWISSLKEPIIDISNEHITSSEQGIFFIEESITVVIDKWFHHSFGTMKRLFHYIREPIFGISNRWSSGVHKYYKVLKFPEYKKLSNFFRSEFKIVTELTSIWDGLDKRTVKLLTTVTSSCNEILQFENTFYYSIEHSLNCHVSSLFEKSYLSIIKQDSNKHIFDILPESLRSESYIRGYIYSSRDKNKKKMKLVLNGMTIEDSYDCKKIVKQLETLENESKDNVKRDTDSLTLQDEFTIAMSQDSLEYAQESNDYNPIHLSYIGARLSGLKDKVCQGMQVWLSIVTQIQLRTSQTAISKEVCFLSPVYRDDILNVSMNKDHTSSSFIIWVRNETTEKDCISASILLIDI